MTKAKRKVMYLNPVGTGGYDEVFAAMAAKYKLPDTEVHVASLPPAQGAFTHIEFRAYEAMVTHGIIRATRAAAKEGFDALAIGCFYDTALHDAREMSGDMVVTAPCLASCRLATNLSNRFGVIVGRRKWVDQMSSTVSHYGYGPACAGFYHVELGVNDFQKDHCHTNNLLTEAARKAVEEGYAESIILGCTLEIGFHETLEAELGVPVIDVSVAALKEAEYAAEMKAHCGWKPSRKWSCEAPPEDELATLGVFDGGDVFGNRIVVPAA
ncbi:aspartate/glutamate racemase family protein [Amaricoccus tamworthensis]|jgi:allantoin racemase|uniref:aspartate/glutamate racemase family protein n=1 Tax=Amaricoccus tamworthensis TaxID=57002 RepID=UPI003C7EAAC1